MIFKNIKMQINSADSSGTSSAVSGPCNSQGSCRLNFTQLCNGNSARVIELCGSKEIISKLEAMGIIPGSVITKKSTIFGKGPIVIEKDLVQLAISYDMAQKIIVEPVNAEIGSGL